MTTTTRSECAALDRDDPLASLRERFDLPEGVIYLDGNSLGPLPRAAPDRLAAVATGEWGRGLIRSWNDADWIAAPRRLGARLAPLIGAKAGEVVVADSTSVNLFKLLVGALGLRPGRHVVLTEAENFPTDLYVAQGVVELLGRDHRLRHAGPDELAGALDDDTALLMLTHVDFRSGRLHDMATLTQAAHAKGALVLWDLSHSAGALPVDLRGADADLAVGCGYKFLNGGPGAPAFLFVAERLQERVRPVITGWMGHAAPFDFAAEYRPAGGVDRHLCGTPPILGMAALEAALEIWEDIDLAEVRRKSMTMGDLLIRLVEERCAAYGFTLASPREAAGRGSQVSFSHPDGYPIMQALIARGVIGDFRAPDLMRFGITPLYLRYVDLWDAVEALADLMAGAAWDDPRYKRRARVT